MALRVRGRHAPQNVVSFPRETGNHRPLHPPGPSCPILLGPCKAPAVCTRVRTGDGWVHIRVGCTPWGRGMYATVRGVGKTRKASRAHGHATRTTDRHMLSSHRLQQASGRNGGGIQIYFYISSSIHVWTNFEVQVTLSVSQLEFRIASTCSKEIGCT